MGNRPRDIHLVAASDSIDQHLNPNMVNGVLLLGTALRLFDREREEQLGRK
jgi:hypothetical protein